LIFVSGAQTPLPLIHPTHLIFGGAVRGEKQNQGGDTLNVSDHLQPKIYRP
jgi:hypothetical protein